ncbi:hypothetical protein BT96DRAFT_377469 [Gymnopus androsaceus JB14]|uniref:Uncharacterized protein n=1 Tax=Gymnopus androsaceus JB14 TaxID=1447944 RepID=A0A6A4IJ09_9AGAR|nr:hypothetical protein BT96DRAFT_377469 [Gymnopus androsaceus JB14]
MSAQDIGLDLECLTLAPMTFFPGKRHSDDLNSDSSSERESDEEMDLDNRNKPLPVPPANRSISHISNNSTSTVSSCATSSTSSTPDPVTPITPNTPFSLTSPKTQIQTRSRQPSIVSLAGGYHLPGRLQLPLLSAADTDGDGDVDTEVGSGSYSHTRPGPAPGSPAAEVLKSSSASVRRYASAGNLLSRSSPSGSGSLQHQYSYSDDHPLSLSFSSSPYPSTPTSLRSRAGSTSLNSPVSPKMRNAVYIDSDSDLDALTTDSRLGGADSGEVERRLRDLEDDVSTPRDDVSEASLPSDSYSCSKWSPASSVVDLREPRSLGFNLSWGFPKPPKTKTNLIPSAPPSTPTTVAPAQNVFASHSRSSFSLTPEADASAPITKDAALPAPAPAPVPFPVLASPTLPESESQTRSQDIPTPGGKRRQSLTSFFTRRKISGAVGVGVAQVPPVPVPQTPPKAKAHRPAPLDLSSVTKITTPVCPTSANIGASESEPPSSASSYSNSVSSPISDAETETETEIEDSDSDMDSDMDMDLIAVAAGFDLPVSPRTPTPSNESVSTSKSPVSPGLMTPTATASSSSPCEQEIDLTTPTFMDGTGRGSYAQVYGFRSPRRSTKSFAHLPSPHIHSHTDEASVPRGGTPTIGLGKSTKKSQSLISPGDLPPSSPSRNAITSPKTPRPPTRPPLASPPSSTRTSSSSSTASAILAPPTSPKPASPRKSPKKSRMSGFISRFTLGSSTSLSGNNPHLTSASDEAQVVPPVPPLPLPVDELGQIVIDPFAKDDTTTSMMGTRPSSFISPSPSLLSGTASPSNFDSLSIICSPDPQQLQPGTALKKKRRSLGLTLSSLRSPLPGQGHGKKRKMVVSGVASYDAYQAVKNWCESFGEVKNIETRENGNLVVDWRRRSVSDMVCRVQATVFIKGAGSVAISWYQS